MSDRENQSGIIPRASDSETPDECVIVDYPDMSKDLPMQNAIDVVNASTRAVKERQERFTKDFKRFFKTLRDELINRGLLEDDDDRPTSQTFFQIIPKYSREIFTKLRQQQPSYRDLRTELKKLIARICTTLQRDFLYTENDYSDLADNLMPHVWTYTVQPYVRNMLLRETAIESVDLLSLWHSAIESEDLSREEAIEQLEYCAEKANDVSKLFTEDQSVYFCDAVQDTNNIDELQRLWNEEKGDSVSSWEKKHGAFVKASLMYAIHMIDGTICRKETNMVMKDIRKRIESVCKDLGGDEVLLNPNQDGEIGPNSLILNKIDYNSKDPESEYLKFITKLLSDDIAPDAHTTADRHRFRGYLLEDPRKSHPLFENYPVEMAEIAAATRFLAIVMMRFGTTVDKRNVRNSITTGQGINDKSGRVHRALQWKGSIFVDRKPDGTLRDKAKSYMYECQALCHVPEGSYEADVAEYRRKKILKAQKVLGVGINFSADTLNLCDVFVNRYTFSHDTPEMRELAEMAFGGKMQRVPFMKEMVANKIVGRLVSDDPQTMGKIRKLFKRRSSGKKLKQTLEEMEEYVRSLRRHCLNRKSLHLYCIVADKVQDEVFVSKVNTLKKFFAEGQLIETSDINRRVHELQALFEDYAFVRKLSEYDEETYLEIRELLEEIHFIAHKGPSGLEEKMNIIRERYKVSDLTEHEESQTTNYDQLSLFGDESEK